MITSPYSHCSGRLMLLPDFKIPFNGGGVALGMIARPGRWGGCVGVLMVPQTRSSRIRPYDVDDGGMSMSTVWESPGVVISGSGLGKR